MAVLIEAISVVIKRSVIDDKYPGGIEGFKRDAPNKTFCADEHLARIGFMSPVDVKAYCKELASHGFIYHVDQVPEDFVVIDQQSGPVVPCEWVVVWTAFLEAEEIRKIMLCAVPEEFDRLSQDTNVFEEPNGWKWEGSLSQTFAFAPSEEVDKSFTYLGHDNGLDVYFNDLSGKLNYVGRTGEITNP